MDKVAASLQEFGWRQPIVTDPQFVIIVGHTRYLAAQKLELREVPVHIAEDLTPAQLKAYRIADNRLHEDSSWDHELLPLELEELRDLDFSLESTGFSLTEIEGLLEEGLPVDREDEWRGLPEYEQPDVLPFHTVRVHLDSEQDLAKFQEAMGQTVTRRTRTIWFPYRPRADLKAMGYYVAHPEALLELDDDAP